MKADIHAHLVKELRRGSYEAFSKLYLMYADQLFAFVLKLTKSPAKSQDILQETFMRIWDKRSNIKSDLTFKSYLFQISYHIIVDEFRKQINNVDFENYIKSEHFQNYSENNVEQLLNYDEYQKRIAQILSSFTKRQQLIFRLSRLDELSAKDIANQLCITEKTVNNQLSLILTAIRKKLIIYLLLITI